MGDYSNMRQLLGYVEKNYENEAMFNDKVSEQWIPTSVKEYCVSVRRCAAALWHMGLRKGDSMAIISNTNTPWLILDLAIMSIGAVSVPMFPNVSMQNLEFQLRDSDIRMVYLDSDLKQDYILGHRDQFVKIITRGPLALQDDNVLSFDELIQKGQLLLNWEGEYAYGNYKEIHPGDLATIVYTSGSTGEPKGVELSHKNLVSQLLNIKKIFKVDTKTDTAVSFLPTAHVFERTVVYFYLSRGISTYFVPDIKLIGDIIREVKPTMLTVVPRVLEKVYSKMVLKARDASTIKRFLALKAIKRANRKRLLSQKNLQDHLFDKLVYTKLRLALGGRLRMVISGGAPLARSLARFFTNIGVNIYQGYGLTESSPVISANYPGSNKNGTVGKVLPGVRVLISDEGEILASGDNIMLGYHNKPNETARVLDEDGMLHTGDLGHVDEEGYLSITGRKKELFKTSTGEYVSPIPIEQKLRSHELIGNALVVAEGRKYVSCILFPAYEELPGLKMKWGMEDKPDQEFYESGFVQNSLKSFIDCINQTLNPWEQIRKFKIVYTELSIDRNELTPKLNIRRSYVYNSFKNEIENMYMVEVPA